MDRRKTLKTIATGGAAAMAFPHLQGLAQANRYARYKGQTVVINYPAHPHYDQAE